MTILRAAGTQTSPAQPGAAPAPASSASASASAATAAAAAVAAAAGKDAAKNREVIPVPTGSVGARDSKERRSAW
jgi:hypothetical protein